MPSILELLSREIALSTIHDFSALEETILLAQMASLYDAPIYWAAVSRLEALEVAQMDYLEAEWAQQ